MKMGVTAKSKLQIQCNAHQNPNVILHRNTKINLKFTRKNKRTLISKTILNKKERCWRHHIPVFKLHYKAIATKMAWCWHKNRHEDHWNRIEDLDTKPQSHGHLIFDKGAKDVHWRKDRYFF
jgi:hypothetical protein